MKFSQRVGFGSRRLAKESPGSLGREHEMPQLKDVSSYMWPFWVCFAISDPLLVSTQSRDLLKHCKSLCKALHHPG